jgi:uncharacterized repeat protein (TIGR02543 family)
MIIGLIEAGGNVYLTANSIKDSSDGIRIKANSLVIEGTSFNLANCLSIEIVNGLISRALNGIELNGTGNYKIGFITVERGNIVIGSAGNLIIGSIIIGEDNLNGNIIITGSGSIDADQIIAQNGEIKITVSGDMEIGLVQTTGNDNNETGDIALTSNDGNIIVNDIKTVRGNIDLYCGKHIEVDSIVSEVSGHIILGGFAGSYGSREDAGSITVNSIRAYFGDIMLLCKENAVAAELIVETQGNIEIYINEGDITTDFIDTKKGDIHLRSYWGGITMGQAKTEDGFVELSFSSFIRSKDYNDEKPLINIKANDIYLWSGGDIGEKDRALRISASDSLKTGELNRYDRVNGNIYLENVGEGLYISSMGAMGNIYLKNTGNLILNIMESLEGDIHLEVLEGNLVIGSMMAEGNIHLKVLEGGLNIGFMTAKGNLDMQVAESILIDSSYEGEKYISANKATFIIGGNLGSIDNHLKTSIKVLDAKALGSIWLDNKPYKESSYEDDHENGYWDGYWEGLEAGNEGDHENGYWAGYWKGYAEGNKNGYMEGYGDGYAEGYENGYWSGYWEGYSEGFSWGYWDGDENDYEIGYSEGLYKGLDDGYKKGFEDSFIDRNNEIDLTIEKIESNGSIYLNNKGAVNIVRIISKGGNSIEIHSTNGIYNVAEGGVINLTGGNMTLNSGAGPFGTEESPITIALTEKAELTIISEGGKNYIVNQYTVTFVDHNGNVLKTQKVNYGCSAIAPADPTRTGYTFVGWDCDFSNITGDITITAIYSANTYTITFDARGGTVGQGTKTVTYDANYGELPTPTRIGHTFLGWYDAEVDGTNITSETIVTTAADHTLYARWSIDTYNIIYDLGGGINDDANPTSYTIETETITLKDASRTGYTFDGWYDSAVGGNKVTEIAIGSTGNVEFYARWTANNYAITYNLDGGTNDGTNPTGYTIETETITLKDASRTGYTFDGWYDSAVGGNKVTEIVIGSTGHIELYARWTIDTYTITYDLGGGTNDGDNPTSYAIGTATITLKPATKTGYTFVGWYDAAEDGNKVTEIVTGSTGNKTLYARWTANTYTITYNLDGGTNGGDNPTNYTIETETITLKPATKTGYKFDGWYDSATGGNKVTEIVTGSTGHKTLYARWTIDSYTITYDLGGGTNDKDNPTSYTIETGSIILKAATRNGYTFVGWFDAETGGNEVIQITKGSSENKTLYARWEINTYNIIYNLGGGTNDGTNPTSYMIETETITLKPATKTGYTFDGWYDAATGGNEITQITKGSTGNVELYARWKINSYTITYNLDGGTNYEDNPINYTMETETITLKPATKTGYTFVGWFDAAEGGNKVTEITKGSTGDKTLYARFEINQYTVIFKDHNGTVLKEEMVNYSGSATAPANPARTGYTFTGWDINFSNIIEDITVTATYRANTYEINFDVQGGTVEPETITVTYDDKYGELPIPTRIGYTFLGWYDTPIGGTNITNETMVTTAANHTLYARWTAIEYTITYNLSGGTNDKANPAKYTIEAETITLKDATRAGYSFVGWFDAQTEGDEVTQITKGSTTNITLYARWEIVTYFINYNLDGGTNDTNNPTNYTVETETFTLKPATKIGYTFAGWFDGEGNQLARITKGSTGDKTLHAHWIINNYTISYNLDGGVNGANPISYTIETETLALRDATKAGYIFIGWYDAKEGGNEVTEITKGSTGNKTLYARWKVIEYTLTFDAQGGEVATGTKSVSPNALYGELPVPTKTGYTFQGWYDPTRGGIDITSETIVTIAADHTLYARWTATDYTIVYNLDGGVNDGNNPDGYTIETDDIVLKAAIRNGYTFVGWFDAGADGNKITEIAKGSIGNKTLYARWAINQYTVTFVDHDGTVLKEEIVNYNSGATAPADPERIGYTFTGWDRGFDNIVANMTITALYDIDKYTVTYKDHNGEIINISIVDSGSSATGQVPPIRIGYTFIGWDKDLSNITENIEVTAQWIINQYTITFDSNGGSAVASITQDYDTEITLPDVPTKLGYTFIGWNFEIPSKMPAEDMTLTALWTATEYAIIYNLDGGVNDGTNPAKYTIETEKITLKDATKTGYTFDGWYDETGNKVTEIAKGGTGNKNLYARWTINQYTVTFKDHDGTVLKTDRFNYGSPITAPAAPIREGYTFIGWSPALPAKMPAEDITLTALWTATEYAIIYNLDGGVNDGTNPAKYTIETEEITLKDATRIGYTFDGWYDETGNKVTEIAKGNMGNKTLYARWTINQYTVTFKGHDGTVLKTETLNYGGSIIAPAAPTRTGYTFSGWSPAIPSKMPAEDMTFTALYRTDNTDTPPKEPTTPTMPTTPITPTVPEKPEVSATQPSTVTVTTKAKTETKEEGKITAKVDENLLREAIAIAKEAVKAQEEAMAKEVTTGEKIKSQIKIDLGETKKAKTIVTIIPAEAFGEMVKKDIDSLIISSDMGELIFDNAALNTITKEAKEEIRIEIAKVDTEGLSDEVKEKVKDRPVYDFNIKSGEKKISELEGKVKISLPYTLKEVEDPNALIVYFINDDGKPETISNVRYDADVGAVVFETNRFFKYVIGHNKIEYKDVSENAWYRDAVTFIGARGITNGTSIDTFNPEGTLSRGQFITLLMRAYGIAPTEDYKDNFKDANDTYYTGYLATAKKFNLAEGVGDNKFAPEDSITRQDMMTLLYNTLRVIDKLPKDKPAKGIDSFIDNNEITDYAKEAMDYLTKAGIIAGSNGKLAPKDTTTRAQFAQVLYNLMNRK